MKLRLTLLVSFLMFLSGFGSLAMTSMAASPAVDENEAAALYANYCAGCHGAQREGGYGPALTDLEALADAELFEIIAQGKSGMPALGEKLNDEQIQALVGFIKGEVGGQLQGSEGEKAVPPVVSAKSDADASVIFGEQCTGCHGAEGQGGYGPALTDLGGRTDAELLGIIARGADSMPGFEGRLGEAEIEALVSFIRKFSAATSEEGKTEEIAQAVTAAAPARLSLDLSPGAGGVVTARVSLQSESGEPIADTPLVLYRQTVMGGNLALAEATTDSRGEAIFQLAAMKGQTLALEAVYAGSDQWRPASAQGKVKLPGSAVLPPVVSGLTSPTPPPAFVAVLVVVIGGVWATYSYVVYQLVCIAVQREK